MSERPQFWMFAGPNGADKSTLVRNNRVADRIPVINPDVIAFQIDPALRDKMSVVLKAGKIAAAERSGQLQAGRSFAIETTLAGHSELRVLADAHAAGFKMTLALCRKPCQFACRDALGGSMHHPG